MTLTLMQNNPTTFQTSDMQTWTCLDGVLVLEGCEGVLSIDASQGCVYVTNVWNDDSEVVLDYEHEAIPGHIGGCFWLSALAMILWIQSNKELFAGKHVLELGAGIGLPSKYIREICVGTHVTESDCDVYGKKHIDWMELDPHDTDVYDIVIASDCCYRDTWRPLVDTIGKYLDPQNGMMVVFNADRNGIDDMEYAFMEMFGDALSATDCVLTYNQSYQTNLRRWIGTRNA